MDIVPCPSDPRRTRIRRLLRTASGITLIFKVTVFNSSAFNSSAKSPDSCDAAYYVAAYYVVSHVRAVCRPPVKPA